jgi:hypothetical protein
MLEISGATDECTEQPQFRRATQNSHRLVLDGVAHQTGRLRFLWRQSTRDRSNVLKMSVRARRNIRSLFRDLDFDHPWSRISDDQGPLAIQPVQKETALGSRRGRLRYVGSLVQIRSSRKRVIRLMMVLYCTGRRSRGRAGVRLRFLVEDGRDLMPPDRGLCPLDFAPR